MGHPRPLFVYFCLFKQTLQFFQQVNVKKCPSSICCWDSNPRPLEHESPTITTRPGLPPYKWAILAQDKFLIIGPIVFLLVFVLFHITIQIEIA